MTEATAAIVPPDAGKTTVDDKMFFETERLSYQCAEAIAYRIAGEVRADLERKTVVIVGTPLLADFANLDALLVTLTDLQNEYEAIATRADGVVQARVRPDATPLLSGGKVRRFDEALMPEVGVTGALLKGITGAAIAGVATPAVGAVQGNDKFGQTTASTVNASQGTAANESRSLI